MTQIKEYVKIAIMNIKANRGRSILTMLGIIIGISSVIMVMSIGTGVKNGINSELDGIAGGQIQVYIDTTRKDSTARFTLEDVDAIVEKVENVKGATPVMNSWGTAEGPKGTSDILFSGGTIGLQYDGSTPIVKGRYFTQNEYDAGEPVCVINESSARLLFGTTDVVGMTFDATSFGMTQEMKIVGIRGDSQSNIVSMLGGGGYIEAATPLSVLVNKYGFLADELSSILIFANKAENSTQIAKDTKTLLENRHHIAGENQVLYQSFADISKQYNSILNAITLFVSLVAAISLMVGGIGVMNIMLVSVTERTREIGIRKALGARTKSIMWQFLAEAGIITLIGGIIGIIIGIATALLIGGIIKMPASISLFTVFVASVFSCGIGVFFGIYPAKKAARLSPIEALRHE